MADDDRLKPMNDGDIVPPPASTEFTPAEPLKDAPVAFSPDQGGDGGANKGGGAGKDAAADKTASAAETASGEAPKNVRDNLTGLGTQAADRFYQVFDDGKEKIGGLLDQLVRTLTDAADQVDDKLGGQYGGYARDAAASVQELAQTVRDKDADELADDIRGYVRKSPTAALGVAAVLGFALARVAHAGLDQRS